MVKLNELDSVVLTTDLPDEGLCAGDLGAVVHVYDGGKAYEVEFVTLGGDTVAVATLDAGQVRPIRPDEMAHARPLVV